MRTSIVAVTALAGGLLCGALAQGAHAATPSGFKSLVPTAPGAIELVRQGGGGKGGGGGGGGFSGGGGGGGKAMGGGGPRGGGIARGGGGRPSLGAGPRGGGQAYRGRGGGREFSGRSGGREFSGRNFDRNWNRGGRDYRGGRYAHRNDGKYDRRNYGYRNRYVYGAPFLGYGAYAYAGDCYWLRQQALTTGSAYWWDRYNACVGYGYY